MRIIFEIRKAAEQGHAQAQAAPGVAYAAGNGVPGDTQGAVRWLRKAAEQENAEAQFCLAHL